MNGIVAYGAYLPYFRLDRKAIGESLGQRGRQGDPGRGVLRRGHDLHGGGGGARGPARATRLAPAAIYFATTEPAYLDKTNATAIHAALGLDQSVMAFDMVGSVRSAAGALRAAMAAAGGRRWPCCRDIRTGLPGGADERDGGDGAAAFLFGAGRPRHAVLAEPIGGGVGHRRVPRPLARCPATRPRGSGRSASASTSTARWPRPRSPTR